MTGFFDDRRDVDRAEPTCRVLPIAPLTYPAQIARRADPSSASVRTRRDTTLRGTIQRGFDEDLCAYGVRKVRRQMVRKGESVARLMKDIAYGV
jgi:hypothetical protein